MERGSPGAASMQLSDQLCFGLYSATRAIQRLYRPLLAEHGLTYPQYLVMLVLWEEDGLPVSEVGARLGLDSASTTPLLQRMEQADLILRTRSTSDERQVIVELTTSGRALRDEVQHTTTAVTCAAVDASSDAEALLQALDELVARLPDAI